MIPNPAYWPLSSTRSTLLNISSQIISSMPDRACSVNCPLKFYACLLRVKRKSTSARAHMWHNGFSFELNYNILVPCLRLNLHILLPHFSTIWCIGRTYQNASSGTFHKLHDEDHEKAGKEIHPYLRWRCKAQNLFFVGSMLDWNM